MEENETVATSNESGTNAKDVLMIAVAAYMAVKTTVYVRWLVRDMRRTHEIRKSNKETKNKE